MTPANKHNTNTLRYNGTRYICCGNQISRVTHKHYRTYETVAVHITMYDCTSTLIQVYLYIVHSSTSTVCGDSQQRSSGMGVHETGGTFHHGS